MADGSTRPASLDRAHEVTANRAQRGWERRRDAGKQRDQHGPGRDTGIDVDRVQQLPGEIRWNCGRDKTGHPDGERQTEQPREEGGHYRLGAQLTA